MSQLFDLLQPLLRGIKQSNKEIQYYCPFCQDNKQRLYISTDIPHPWICFHCSKSGKRFSKTLMDALGIMKSADLSKYIQSMSRLSRGGKEVQIPSSIFRPSWADTDKVHILDRKIAKENLQWLWGSLLARRSKGGEKEI